MNETESQAHIFVVWQSGFHELSRIFWELSLEFEIKFAQKIEWNQNEIPERLTRMYPNRDFDLDSPKVKEIGGNELVYILVVDRRPEIVNEVNQKVLRLKSRHRTGRRTHAGFQRRIQNINYLHASDLEADAFFNYQALTGGSRISFEELKTRETLIYLPTTTSSGIELIEMPVPIFDRIEDVFSTLNQHQSYAVLRNWEGCWTSDPHGDVDILTDDYYKTLLVLGAKPVFPQQYRVHHLVHVGTGAIPFDVRFVGDGYYDQAWEEALLDRRVKQDGFYRLSDEDYFWTLLYHGVFHKRGLSDEYRGRLESMWSHNPDRSTLESYLKTNGFTVTKPTDRSIRFHRTTLDQIIFWIKAILRAAASLFRSNREDLSHLSEQTSLSAKKAALSKAKRIKYGVYDIGDAIIKTTDPQRIFLLKHEERMLRAIASEPCFPNVLDSFEHSGGYYLVLEKKSGKSLNRIFSLHSRKVEQFSNNLQQILDALERHRILHRDIRPNNLLVTKDGRVSLVDFQFAIRHGGHIQTHNPLEKYILHGAEKNLGGQWYLKKTPDQDASAINIILARAKEPQSIIKFIRRSLRPFTFS